MCTTSIFCRVLDVALGRDVTSSGIAALAKLEFLQEFLYQTHSYRRSERLYSWQLPEKNQSMIDLYSLCLQLLPGLQISGARLKFQLHKDIPSYLCWNEHRQRLPTQLGLRQLALKDLSRMPVQLALPNLETLFVQSTHFNLDANYPSLTELVLEDISSSCLKKILRSVGNQLLKLSIITMSGGVLKLHRVLRMCPNLQVLHIIDTKMAKINLVDCTMRGILELAITIPFDDRPVFNADCLLPILQAAPDLLILNLKNVYYFSEHDVTDAFSRALEQHTILQKLEKLFVHFDWPDDHESYEQRLLDVPLKNNCFSVIRSMILLCPKLYNVEPMCFQIV